MVASGQSSPLDKASKLKNPASLTETAPATYRANFETTKGTFIIQVNRDWAPLGADRFYLGYPTVALAKLLTFGGGFIGAMVDVVLIATGGRFLSRRAPRRTPASQPTD